MINGAVLDEVDQDVTAEDIAREKCDTDRFLGDAFRVERSGLIRPGIMVPKKGCPEEKVKKYHELVAKEVSWKDIDEALGKDSQQKSWLTMRNVDYFTLRPSDCKDAKHARLIRDLYADTDGKLRKIPISFPFDNINSLISVRLSCYTGGGRKTGRYYGDKLICEQDAIAPQQTTGGAQQSGGKKSEHRTFGPPPKVKTPCNPETCSYYQEKACTMRGGFIFRIPKVPGLGVWAIYTKSAFYAMVSLRSKLKTIQGMAGDYCGLSKMPANIFYLKKLKEKVGRERREQWLITIDSDYPVDDIESMLAEKYQRRSVVGAAAAAVKLRNGTHGEKIDTTTGEVVDEGKRGEGPGQPHVEQTPPAESSPSAPQGSSNEKAAEAPQKQNAAPEAGQKPAGVASPADKGAAHGVGKASSGKFSSRLVSFMKGIRQNELLKHVDDLGLLQSMQRISLKKFNKKLELLSEDEATKIISDVRGDLAKKDVSAFSSYSAAGKAATASQKPGAADKSCPDALGDEWPEDTRASSAKKASTSPAATSDDELFGLGPKIVPFLRTVMKNPLFDGVTSFRSAMEDYSKRTFGKNLASLGADEIDKFTSNVKQALSKNEVNAIIGGKDASPRPATKDAATRVSGEAFQ